MVCFQLIAWRHMHHFPLGDVWAGGWAGVLGLVAGAAAHAVRIAAQHGLAPRLDWLAELVCKEIVWLDKDIKDREWTQDSISKEANIGKRN